MLDQKTVMSWEKSLLEGFNSRLDTVEVGVFEARSTEIAQMEASEKKVIKKWSAH